MGLRVLLPANKAEYIERLTRGEELARSLGDSPIILRALHCRISVSAITGEFNRAALAVDEGLALARHLGAPGWIIRFELVAARFANAVGDEEQALRLSLSAPATAKRGRDTRAILEAAVLLQLWIPGSAAASAAVPSPSELIAMAGAIRQTAIQTVLLPSFALQALAAGDSAAAADWCAQGLELSAALPWRSRRPVWPRAAFGHRPGGWDRLGQYLRFGEKRLRHLPLCHPRDGAMRHFRS